MLWMAIRDRLIRYLQHIGCDFTTAEDIAGTVYDVMARKLTNAEQAFAFARTCARNEFLEELRRRKRFNIVHPMQDDDGAWHDPLDFVSNEPERIVTQWRYAPRPRTEESRSMNYLLKVPGAPAPATQPKRPMAPKVERKSAQHGTKAMYNNHKCRCDACRAANAVDSRRRRKNNVN